MTSASTWIVGLDLDGRARGALVVGEWIARGGNLVGVHVLESWARPHIRGDAFSAVHALVVRTTRELHLPALARVTVLEATRAEEGLAEAAQAAAGLIIGRAAPAHEDRIVRLGVVARQLLRQLPLPVIVVPPDLAAVAPGPVLFATDLGPSGAQALGFARELAGAHGRPLELLHVADTRHHDLIDDLDPGFVAARAAYHAAVAASFGAWADAHELTGNTRHVGYGDPAARIAAVAAERRAALVVVGSRRLGTVARAFLSSTASALAGLAACPVAVVPLLGTTERT